MDELEERLRTWRAAGLLSDEQTRAIAAFEGAAIPESDDRRPVAPRTRRAVLAEAVGYVGAALALGAVAALLAEVWDELTTGGTLTVVALLGVVLAGAAAGLRMASTPALTRLVGVLWLGVVASAAWFAGLVASEVLGAEPAATALAVGSAGLVVAVPVLLVRPSIPAQLAVLATALVAALAAMSLPELLPAPVWYGLVVWALGVAWALLGHGRWVSPPVAAEVLGGLVALVGGQVASVGDQRLLGLVLAVATATVLVVLAVVADGLLFLVLGAVGLFVLVPQFVFELFGDAIGAPATLLVVGLLLVLLAVGLGRAGREVGRDAGRQA